MLSDPTVFPQWLYYDKELSCSYERRLREVEETLWRSHKGSSSEMEGSKIISKARLRKMKEFILRWFEGSPSEMEELRSTYGPRLEVIEELRIIYEPRLRVIEGVNFRKQYLHCLLEKCI